MPKYFPTGTVELNWSGTFLKTTPMPTDMSVIRPRAATEPTKLSHLPTRMASRAAIKNVLSPSSDRKIRVKAARKPDCPKGDLAAYSCNRKEELLSLLLLVFELQY